MAHLHSRRTVLSAAALASALPILVACSSSGDNASSASGGAATGESSAAPGAPTPTSSIPTTIPEGMGSGQGDGIFPRTVGHFQGSTTIQAPPSKVVIISTGQLDAALTLGVVPVGAAAGDGAKAVPDYLARAFPEQAGALGAITEVGSRKEPNVEAISDLAPDLILVNNTGKDPAALYTTLSNIAPTVVTQGTGQYWKQDFLLLADALGKVDAARTWLDIFHSDAAAAGKPIDGAGTVSLLRKNGDRTRIFGAISFAGSVLADMGVARPQTQSFTEDTSHDISAEQLDQADASWILYGVQGDASALTSAALWPTLGAVTAGRAIQVEDDPFYLNAGPTAARFVLTTVSTTVK
ncbi:iron-siderophore ABC transporter substrate-binding protein [Actinomyces gaoshouyii]|uniref:ABC transporter substrate-binding protein n=1 Tax=Actinomyces gaoshouyii TaxID=1960083 RepID=A0A8H9HCB0_9ACTO|nr:iron-siderophore ABC transporter substrate-binding protein [Actinomyces gaoshouyii]ARD42196.1 iron-siderophore ABC transporter substrate-binding protein [Actinomyces gaoshouyii]GGO96271.1 ABC transporter substrate-binding protein [Actinomyces gaoshouyii]